jgi:hypothetical protein
MNRRTRWFAALAGTALALAMATTVFAYAGQVAGAVTVAGPSGALECNVALTVSATVLDASSNPIEGQPVAWSFTSSPSSADTINSTPTTTNASGVATTTVTLACVAGSRTLTATADDIRASAVLGITAAGLPSTSTAPAGAPAGNLPFAMILALLAVLVGAGLMVRQTAFSRN